MPKVDFARAARSAEERRIADLERQLANRQLEESNAFVNGRLADLRDQLTEAQAKVAVLSRALRPFAWSDIEIGDYPHTLRCRIPARWIWDARAALSTDAGRAHLEQDRQRDEALRAAREALEADAHFHECGLAEAARRAIELRTASLAAIKALEAKR